MDNFSQEDEKELTQEDIETQISFEEPGDFNSDAEAISELSMQESETPAVEEKSIAPNVDDIKFEEVLDIDKLQNELNKQMYPQEEEETLTEETPSSVEDEKNISLPEFQEQPSEFPISPNSKKYVIYVEPYNIEYIESLSLSERKALINKVLREQNESSIHEKGFQAKKSFLINLTIAIVTFVIGFPIIFFCVNKAMEITINNYNQAKSNFTQLYRKNGKIQQNERVIPEVKY